jgi:phosphotriesterase-related protein
MSVVRTVNGDVSAELLGVTDAHDHLVIKGGPATRHNPDLLISDVEAAIDEARAFRDAGGATIVDAMPTGAGRDALALHAISLATGVNVIAASGFHKQDYYGDLHWAMLYPEEVLLDLIVQECEQGIDQYDYAGPCVERTAIRPGLLKAAGDYNRLRKREEMWLHVAAHAQLRTGLPLAIHADHGTMAKRIAGILLDDGVRADRISIFHMDRNPDLSAHLELLEMGVNIVYDGLGRERYRPVAVIGDLIAQIEARGYAGQVMLGADMATRSVRRLTGGIGIASLLTEFVPHLARCGVAPETLHSLLTTVPQRVLSVSAGAAQSTTNIQSAVH